MTDIPTDTQAPRGPVIAVMRQYIKDLSFENPGTQPEDQPKIDLGIDVNATPQAGEANQFEVTLKLRARAGTEDVTLFLIELDYAGTFRLEGFSQSDLEAALLIECPRILFPFARRIIADISSDGGFPPLRIDPVDFAALYQSQRQQAAQQQSAQETSQA
ncbi:MAG: protein-export chaperone SecB [Pseudomonadota bacterium]